MEMLYVYLICLVVGGIVLGGSLLLGAIHGSADADGDAGADADHDVDAGADADADAGADADHDAGGEGSEAGDHGGADATGLWLPFLSVRFWVFTLCFFGLSGTLLTLAGSGPLLTPLLAAAVGLVCGTGAAWAVHQLGKTGTLGHVAGDRDFVGAVGTVLVSVGPGSRGKVRVQIQGQAVDLVATTADDERLAVGAQALVVEVVDDVATVTRAPLEDERRSEES